MPYFSSSLAQHPVNRSFLDLNQSSLRVTSSGTLLRVLRVPDANIPFIYPVPFPSTPSRWDRSGVLRLRYQERPSPANMRRNHRCRISTPLKGYLFNLRKKVVVRQSFLPFNTVPLHSDQSRDLKLLALDLKCSKYLFSSTSQKGITIIERAWIVATDIFKV